MGNFKENKREKMDEGKEKGESGIAEGENRVEELEGVKRLIDSISLEDNEDMEATESLNETYLEAGKAAHQEEVQSVVDSANQGLEDNKNEILAEKSNVDNAVGRVHEMQSTTDLARSSAQSVERSLSKSSNEYKNMEQQTEQIESDLETKSQDILSRIKSVFG